MCYIKVIVLTSAGLRPSREKLTGEGGCEDPKIIRIILINYIFKKTYTIKVFHKKRN